MYVTCEEGESLEVSLQAKEDFTISGFQVLLVNMGQDSRGTLRFVVTDPSSEIVFSQIHAGEVDRVVGKRELIAQI